MNASDCPSKACSSSATSQAVSAGDVLRARYGRCVLSDALDDARAYARLITTLAADPRITPPLTKALEARLATTLAALYGTPASRAPVIAPLATETPDPGPADLLAHVARQWLATDARLPAGDAAALGARLERALASVLAAEAR